MVGVVTGADVVVLCIRMKAVRVLLEEAMVEGDLEASRGGASVFKGQGASIERRGTLAVWADGGLPVDGGAVGGKVFLLPFREKEGFWVWVGGQEGKVSELFPVHERRDESPARETRPLDGVSEKVNIV